MIATIGRFIYLGWFTFGTPSPGIPGNCTLPVAGTDLVIRRNDGTPVGILIDTPKAESDAAALDAATAATKLRYPHTPVIPYWTRALQAGRLPQGRDGIAVDGYRGAGEPLDRWSVRLTAAAKRAAAVGPVWIIAQGYTSNATLTEDLAPMVSGYADIARSVKDIVGILVFSAGGGRSTGWNDHPETHSAWRELAAAIPPPHVAAADTGELLMVVAGLKGIIPYISKAPSGVAGATLYTLPNGRTFSCQADGSAGDRDPGTDGVYEQGQENGNVAAFAPTGKANGVFVYGLVKVDVLQ